MNEQTNVENRIQDQRPEVKVEHLTPPPVVKQESSPEIVRVDSEPANEVVQEEVQPLDEPKETSDVVEDDYGNKTQKKKEKTYSEEQVQAMIRDRLSRGKYAEERQEAKPVQQQSIDPENDASWEVQLEEFIENTLSKRAQKQQQQTWERDQKLRQADFESKFTTGMQKYADFQDVVAQQPITDTMMLAVRDLADPAAFIYAASKTQPKELERISKISDPYQQAAEMGRLDVKMRKARTNVTNAPKPVSVASGDVTGTPKRSIDELIRLDAQNKYRR